MFLSVSVAVTLGRRLVQWAIIDIQHSDSCADVIEKLYYSCGFEPICVHCASEDTIDSEEFLPQCEDCQHLGRTAKPKKKS